MSACDYLMAKMKDARDCFMYLQQRAVSSVEEWVMWPGLSQVWGVCLCVCVFMAARIDCCLAALARYVCVCVCVSVCLPVCLSVTPG